MRLQEPQELVLGVQDPDCPRTLPQAVLAPLPRVRREHAVGQGGNGLLSHLLKGQLPVIKLDGLAREEGRRKNVEYRHGRLAS